MALNLVMWVPLPMVDAASRSSPFSPVIAIQACVLDCGAQGWLPLGAENGVLYLVLISWLGFALRAVPLSRPPVSASSKLSSTRPGAGRALGSLCPPAAWCFGGMAGTAPSQMARRPDPSFLSRSLCRVPPGEGGWCWELSSSALGPGPGCL